MGRPGDDNRVVLRALLAVPSSADTTSVAAAATSALCLVPSAPKAAEPLSELSGMLRPKMAAKKMGQAIVGGAIPGGVTAGDGMDAAVGGRAALTL